MSYSVQISAREVIRYDDADLERHLAQNGGKVRVRDPQNLPIAFIDRPGRFAHNQNGTIFPAQSLAINPVFTWLSKLEATGPKHHSICSRAHSSKGWSGSEGTCASSGSEQQLIRYRESERKYYWKLVEQGARPWYDIDRIEDISKNPLQHHGLLQYWQGCASEENRNDWLVFEKQWVKWEQFRKWQKQQRLRFEGRFHNHETNAKKQLAKHGFTHSFVLKEEWEQQDQLTTWIEYLCHETMVYDIHSRYRRTEARYNEAWQKLVDSGVLKPTETDDFICSDECTLAMNTEWEKVKRAVEAAEDELLLAQEAANEENSAKNEEALTHAQAELDTTAQLFDSFQRRGALIDDFRAETKKHRKRKRDTERQAVFLGWIREQISLIEQETGHCLCQTAGGNIVKEAEGIVRERDAQQTGGSPGPQKHYLDSPEDERSVHKRTRH